VQWLLLDERVGAPPKNLDKLTELRFQLGTVRVYQIYPPPPANPYPTKSPTQSPTQNPTGEPSTPFPSSSTSGSPADPTTPFPTPSFPTGTQPLPSGSLPTYIPPYSASPGAVSGSTPPGSPHSG
ncbi:MAG TPA: hypothetical protein VFF46_27385, partial [Kribbella sp.]|nr:hypothetical protein [Kribbella sp.]